MADYLFVPQSVLDRWSEQGRVEVDGHVLTILGDGKSFTLTSAVRFIKMEAGDDVTGLLQKVKTTDALKQMGAEHYMESVILGESAYEVQQGFLADANALRRAAAVSQAATPTQAKAPVAPPSEASPPVSTAPAVPAPTVSASEATAAPAAPQAKPAPAAAETPAGEQDLLAQFLLENLQ